MSEPLLTLSGTLDLIKGYDDQINTIWNIYVAVIGAIVTLLASDRWKPNVWLLSFVFVIFAGGNLFGLRKFFQLKADLLGYAQTLVPSPPGAPELHQIFGTLKPSSLGTLTLFHLAFDVGVLVIIFLFAQKPPKTARPRAQKS